MAVLHYQPKKIGDDQARYYRIRADKLEREMAVELGELVSGVVVNQRLAKFLAMLRQKILDADLAPEVADDLIGDIGSLKKNFDSLPAL